MKTRSALALALVAAGAGGALAESEWAKEDQTPTGKFLTATEVRPIIEATRANWVAVREYQGQDLLYFTHLLSWRCGLYQIQYSINGAEMQGFPMYRCDPDAKFPATLTPEMEIYRSFPLGSIKTIDVTLLYDDMGHSTAHFDRKNVMTP